MESATIDSPTCVDCLFCNGDFIMTSEIYRDEDMVVIDDIKPSGRSHWLIMPLQHIRSVEGLAATHLPLCNVLSTSNTSPQTSLPKPPE
ncbi:Histidine triad nucleotide-binding protein 3, variant 2 [Drechslerella dactyloides]|uniref:Histidine triad nucleotide-binding protein 3, variant 2 n=1 Tax=Drechslerella dactyloides TaxID=74499 RepID=A0AAD6J240_DREDA|nr:Histidine triad nucleotide-binding protein 3, variant 2 [Drechslerella dactyloides]